MNKLKILIALFLYASSGALFAQNGSKATIDVDMQETIGEISPLVYGQFIEHLGRAIDGGIYEEDSPLSDERGFRKDVLDKMKRLNAPLLRYPGGTFTKIYHWEDGIGPKSDRPAKKNLIWGGIEDNHFGTAEFIEYCREINAEPFLVVNIATGTPKEAANWVEYCNGTGDTYYANLRRSHGYEQPFNVKFWGIGNEESADPDCGRHQDPEFYVKDTWQFVKLMKLTAPDIKLVMVGDYDMHWDKTVLDGMSSVCDYLAVHHYANSRDYISLFENIEGFEKRVVMIDSLIRSYPDKVENFNGWYRFPSRQEPIKIALDEWGIWEGGGTGTYDLEVTYEWRHALGTGVFLNIIQRNSDKIGLATWAQTTNVLAPIMTDKEGSVCQTVFYPLEYFRKYCGNISLKTKVESPVVENQIKSLDVATSFDDAEGVMTFTIVNKNKEKSIETSINLKNAKIQKGLKLITMSSDSVDAKNELSKKSEDVVKIKEAEKISDKNKLVIPPASIVIYQCKVN
ncbi:alpha-N-arabinofuranosidase [Sunxiuqinia sp. A32]|uniref:alpha-N-arabinofuranosidase n=1 Tax=Sunxiuqinia sp. A32 TaxID=3461496 RepID=UPI00404670B2